MNIIYFLWMYIFSQSLNISSPAFKAEGYIPLKYTCEGENVNPPLVIEDIPKNTKSLAIIMADPDAPVQVFNHWVIWNIPPSNTIKEKTLVGIKGKNDFEANGYGGPCPPSGTHRYFIMVYALDGMLNLTTNTDRAKLEQAMQGHILASGQLIGLYQKKYSK